jgi:hypothetical protein
MTSSGKVQKFKLREIAAVQVGSGYAGAGAAAVNPRQS